MFLNLGEVALCRGCPMYHSSTFSSHYPMARNELFLGSFWPVFAHSVLQAVELWFSYSSVCPLVGEAGWEACAGFLERGVGACPLVGWNGSWFSCGQGHVKGRICWWLWAQEVFRQPVCWWVWLCSHSIVWPEKTQHWSLQAVAWGQVLVPETPNKIFYSCRWTLPSMSTTNFYDPGESQGFSLPPWETLPDQQVVLA